MACRRGLIVRYSRAELLYSNMPEWLDDAANTHADLLADARARLDDPVASEFEKQAARTVLRMRQRDGRDRGAAYGTDDGELRFRHRAPNGKESNLDERQYDEVRTENFKKWFGDWELGYLYKMATDVWSGDKSQKRYDFSPSERAAARFKEILGHDVTKLVITSDTIRHIKSHHGNDESRGQINMTADDIVLLPYLIDNYDSMELSPKYDDKLGNRAIEIRKRVNGTTIVATIERGKENEHVVTSWKYKKSDALDAQGTPGLHVRNDSDLAKVKQEIETIKNVAKKSSKIVEPAMVKIWEKKQKKFGQRFGRLRQML